MIVKGGTEKVVVVVVTAVDCFCFCHRPGFLDVVIFCLFSFHMASFSYNSMETLLDLQRGGTSRLEYTPLLPDPLAWPFGIVVPKEAFSFSMYSSVRKVRSGFGIPAAISLQNLRQI